MAAKAAKKMGRPTIFEKDVDVHGKVSQAASVRLEILRKKLAELTGWDVKKIGDGDVIEYTLRGEISTKIYLKEKSGEIAPALKKR